MLRRFKAVIPSDFPMFGAPWLVSGLSSPAGCSRLANVMPPLANLVISSVAVSPVPAYFDGAKLVSYYPVSIADHGMALNVTVQSCNGRMTLWRDRLSPRCTRRDRAGRLPAE